jgi:hypothetical protein
MVLDNRMVQVQRMGSLKNKLEDMERKGEAETRSESEEVTT